MVSRNDPENTKASIFSSCTRVCVRARKTTQEVRQTRALKVETAYIAGEEEKDFVLQSETAESGSRDGGGKEAKSRISPSVRPTCTHNRHFFVQSLNFTKMDILYPSLKK